MPTIPPRSGVFRRATPREEDMTVLLVDGCSKQRARMSEALLLHGFRTASSASISDAMGLASAVRPNLVLMSLQFGFYGAAQLRNDPATAVLPIVVYVEGGPLQKQWSFWDPAHGLGLRPIQQKDWGKALRRRVLQPLSPSRRDPFHLPEGFRERSAG